MVLGLGIGAGSASAATSSDAAASDAQDHELHDPADCSAVFGDEGVWMRHASYRAPRLHDFGQRRHGLEIVHSVSTWTAPTSVRLTGLDLVGVEMVETEPLEPGTAAGEELVAIVELKEPLDSMCQPGLYAVSADDALGRDTKVLAVEEYGVLVEKKGRLGLLQWPGARPPAVRMVWQSGYQVVLDDKVKGAATASAAKNNRAAARKKATRRRRNKK